jgi:hypothetical protein
MRDPPWSWQDRAARVLTTSTSCQAAHGHNALLVAIVRPGRAAQDQAAAAQALAETLVRNAAEAAHG